MLILPSRHNSLELGSLKLAVPLFNHFTCSFHFLLVSNECHCNSDNICYLLKRLQSCCKTFTTCFICTRKSSICTFIVYSNQDKYTFRKTFFRNDFTGDTKRSLKPPNHGECSKRNFQAISYAV